MHSKQTSKGFYIAAILVFLGYVFGTTRADKLGISFEREPKDEIVLYGSTVVLDCSADSVDGVRCTVTWYVGGHQLKPTNLRQRQLSNGSLWIENFQKSDEGEYACLVSSGGDARLSRSATVGGATIESTLEEGAVHDLSIPEGHNVLLHCGIEGTPTPTIYWTKDYEKIATDSRERLLVLPSNDLHVLNATRADAGLYVCHGHNEAGHKKGGIFKVTLDETGSTEPIKALNSKDNVEVLLGQPAILECLWSFSQSVWYRGGSPLERHPKLGSSLLITNATFSDSGEYDCRNSEDAKLSTVVTLDVIAPPRLLNPREFTVRVRAGSALNMTCLFEAHPIQSIRWFKNGKILKNTSRLTTRTSTPVTPQGLHLHRAELLLDHSISSDSGIYQCLIFNQAGAIDAAFFVSTLKPAAPQKLKARPTADREMELSWEEPPDAKDLTGYTIHYWSSQDGKEVQHVTDRRRDTIIHLLPYTNYTFYVKAHTKYDISEPSEFVSQTTNEEVPVSLPQVTLEADGASSIMVEWDNLTSMQANGVVMEHRVILRNFSDGSTRTYHAEGSSYSMTIEDLKPGTRYDVIVLSGTKVGFPKLENLENEQWQSIFLSEQEVYYPENLSVRVVNATAATVGWEVRHHSESVELYGFKIQCRSPGKKVQRYFTRESDRTYLLSNLDPGSYYEIDVRSFSKVGSGNPAFLTFSTPLLQAPVDLKAKALNETAIQLSVLILDEFVLPGEGDDVRICYGVYEGEVEYPCRLWKTLDARRKSSVIVMNNFLPLTNYFFGVQNLDNWLSAVVTCRTGLPAPERFRFSQLGGNRLNISWSFPDDLKENVSFKVSFKSDVYDGRTSDWHEDFVPGSSPHYVLANYSSSRVYFVRVTSVAAGDSSNATSDVVQVNAVTEGQRASYNRTSITVIVIIAVVASVLAIILLVTLALRRWCRRGKHEGRFNNSKVLLEATSKDPHHHPKPDLQWQQDMPSCNGNSSHLRSALPCEPLLANRTAALTRDDDDNDDSKMTFSFTQEASVQMQNLNESTV